MLPTKTYFTKTYQVTADFFANGVLQIPKVMHLIEDIAKIHAQKLGFGFDDMIANDLLWMVSKGKICFAKQITPQTQSITITTWPAKNRKAFCNRYCVAVDEKGCEVFSSAYVWLMVDAKRRALASAQSVAKMYDCDFDDATPNVTLTFDKVVFDGDGWQSVGSWLAQERHLDENNHVNNTHYMALALCGESCQIAQTEITYNHETLLGESLQLYKKQVEGCVCVCGVKSDGTVSFTAKYTLM